MRRYNIVLLMLCLSSCDKKTIAPSYNDKPVIEGYLYANNYIQIRVSRQVASSDNVVYSKDNIDSLDIKVNDGDSIYTLVPLGNGVYTNTKAIVKEDKNYTIQFSYNNTSVSATTNVPSAPRNFTQSVTQISVTKIDSNFTPSPGGFQMNDPIELKWSNGDNSYYMLLVNNLETNLELIRDTTNARFRTISFRNEPSVINSYELRDQQFQYFGKHMLILYHLNPDYAALYTNNSNSSQNLANPTTNIINGLGIFTGISSDTLYLQVNKK